MSIFILSNREVYKDNSGKERFKDKGKEHALPKFRVANCTIKNDEINYNIVKNQYPLDYTDVVQEIKNEGDGNSLHGSNRMFFDLYKNMYGEKRSSDTLVFIHGFANSFEKNLEHIKRLYELFIEKEDSPIENLIYVSWPTRNHKVFTYWDDQKDAVETGRVLARVYDKMYEFFMELFKINEIKPCGSKLHLAAHSMGNQVLEHMLENIPDRKVKSFFSEVLLLHSDVKNDVFEKGRPFTKLEKLAERTHLYIHNSDDALWVSRFSKNLNKRLGKKGPSNRNNLNDETFIVDGTNSISSKSLRERLWDHWGYIESKKEINDIIQVLNGKRDSQINGRIDKKGEDNYFYI